MAEKLGIFVTSDRHLNHVIGLVEAAKKAGKETIIFFTHKGVALTQVPQFKEPSGKAEMTLCNVKFEEYGFPREVPGFTDKQYGTQARHSMLIEECDRYVVM